MQATRFAPSSFFYAPIIAISTLLAGCGSIFCSRNQWVTINSATPGGTITYNGAKVGETKARVKFRKRRTYQQLTVTKEGYKSANHIVALNKRSPAFAFAVLDAFPLSGWMMFIMMDLGSPRTFRYKKVQNIPALEKLEPRNNEKYLQANKIAIEAAKEDITYIRHKGMKRYNAFINSGGKKSKNEKSLVKESISVENTVFTDALNSTLVQMGFIDTNSVFSHNGNSLYLNATIKKIIIHEVAFPRDVSTSAVNPNSLVCAELHIDWELLDVYKQKVTSLQTTRISGMYAINTHKVQWHKDKPRPEDSTKERVADAIKDNIQLSFMQVRKELAKNGFLKMSGDARADTSMAILIERQPLKAGSRINDYLKSSVTVKVDDGHGSGVVISANGYIVTNYHVVAGTKKTEIIFDDGTSVIAEVVKTNPLADLALLKINKDGLQPLPLNESQAIESGTDVWAIGTPRSLELGQSVSKGVVSNTRAREGIDYIQTDVKVNPGNSGGALINKDGLVLGIVSSKIVGTGIEGLSFAIATREVFSKLNIKYK